MYIYIATLFISTVYGIAVQYIRRVRTAGRVAGRLSFESPREFESMTKPCYEDRMPTSERESMVQRSESRAKALQPVASRRIRPQAPAEDADADAQNMAVQLQAASEGVTVEEIRSRSGRAVRPAAILDL